MKKQTNKHNRTGKRQHSHHPLSICHCQSLQSDHKWLHSLGNQSYCHHPEKWKITIINLSKKVAVLSLENNERHLSFGRMLMNAVLTLSASCKTATSNRIYSVAALSVSTLLGLRSGRISGTMRFKRENMVFKFLICTKDGLRSHNKCGRLGHWNFCVNIT